MQTPFLIGSANAAIAGAIMASSIAPEPDANWQHGRITTANDSHLVQASFSIAETRYATGWRDEAGYDKLVEFLAPSFEAEGERFEHAGFSNAEAFLSDGANEDIRALNADFKTVEQTETRVMRKVVNRGLRMEFDWDRIKNKKNWKRRAVDSLIRRLKRNQYRRAVALAVASATTGNDTWSTSTDPDALLKSQMLAAKDSSGILPNRVLMGDVAWSLRYASYGGAGAGAFAGRDMSLQQVGQMHGFIGMEDGVRYQNGPSKDSLLGSKYLCFTGLDGANEDDPSNFKLAWIPCATGGRYAVWIRQISVKKWEVIVEHYERLFAATTLGVRLVTVS